MSIRLQLQCLLTRCLSCFLSRTMVPGHASQHDYKIRSAQLPLVEQAWVAADDLKLFDAVRVALLVVGCNLAQHR